MAILFTDITHRRDTIYALVKKYMPDHDVRLWPDVGNPDEIDYAIAWKPVPNSLQGLPSLKALFLTSAGVDATITDVTLPDVPVIRCVNTTLSDGMAEHVAYHVLKFHRQFHKYEQQQRDHSWVQLRQPGAPHCTVGIMGMGEMGQACVRVLQAFGYTLRGWSRTPKNIAGVEHFSGDDALRPFLNGCHIVVCVLPLTDETRGILCTDNLQHLPVGSYLISAGRGGHMDADDILSLVGNGHLAGAALDVFETEPLPSDHPFWSEPNIIVTPHIASITDYAALCADIKEQMARHAAGQPFRNVVNRVRGY